MDQRDHAKELSETFEAITRKRPVYKELVERFQDLFEVQAELAREFADQDLPLTAPNPARHSQGVSMLADTGLPDLPEQFQTAKDKIFPVLERCFPFAEEMAALGRDKAEGGPDIQALARAYLENDLAGMESEAQRLEIRPSVLYFAIRSLLGPVLAAVAMRAGPGLEEYQWGHGYCPVCGSAPAIATLSKIVNEREENLVGGGGKKCLTCSMCSHQWTFRRDACPACGNTDHDKRELIFAEGEGHERIEACKDCGTYLLCVDLREVDGDPRPEALPLGLVHLDLIARDKDYAPLAVLPWNMS